MLNLLKQIIYKTIKKLGYTVEIKKLNGFLNIEEMNLFANLINAQPQNNNPILEIGVFCGRSLTAMACVSNLKTVGVDPFFEDFNNKYAVKDEAIYLARKTGQTTAQERIKKIYNSLKILDKKIS